jgi:hypothetical protein
VLDLLQEGTKSTFEKVEQNLFKIEIYLLFNKKYINSLSFAKLFQKVYINTLSFAKLFQKVYLLNFSKKFILKV